jgi:hypothetical protein
MLAEGDVVRELTLRFCSSQADERALRKFFTNFGKVSRVPDRVSRFFGH